MVDRRGQWDRATDVGERSVARRSEILVAALRARATHGCSATVAHVIASAGVGRNTFYELFDDVRDAIRTAALEGIERTTTSLDRALAEAMTPIERLRGCARVWIERAHDEPLLVEILASDGELRDIDRKLRSELGARVAAIFRSAKQAGAVARSPDRFRVECVVGAFEAAAVAATAPDAGDSRQLAEILADLTLRAFR